MTRRLAAMAALLAAALWPAARGLGAQERGAVALGKTVQSLGTSTRVLVIGAHPDDEDTQLITWLAKRAHAEVAYLSLTRGDGGQNIIGNELGEGLGVIRTEELLAARRIDGGSQYFTRAYDFGYSKSADETFRHWPRDSILSDVVTVVRVFRPHIIVSVFSGTTRDGHGQHQVAGLLAREAYDLAGDTVRFPRARTAGHGAWHVAKLYRSARFSPGEATLRINVGEYDRLLGRSYAEIAGESRSQHKSQEFGNFAQVGVAWDYLRFEATRVDQGAGGPLPDAERPLFEGIDTTWARLRTAMPDVPARAALDSLPRAIEAASAMFAVSMPAQLMERLERVARLSARLCGIPSISCESGTDRVARTTRTPPSLADAERSLATLARRVSEAVRLASGVEVVATVERAALAVGDSIAVDVAVHNRAGGAVKVIGFRTGGTDVASRGHYTMPDARPLARDSVLRWQYVAHGGRASQPWWLAAPRVGELFGVPLAAIADGPALTPAAGARDRVAPTDIAENRRPASVQVTALLETAGGVRFTASAPAVHRRSEFIRGDTRQPLVVAPAVALTVGDGRQMARAGVDLHRDMRVQIRSAAADTIDVVVELALPAGLTTSDARRPVRLAPGQVASLDFVVTGTLRPGRHIVGVAAISRGRTYRTGFSAIRYPHIRPQVLYRPSSIALEAVDLAVPERLTVGYIPGGSDNVAPVLQQLGIPVTILEPGSLRDAELSRFSTIVVGPRAYESQLGLGDENARALAENNARLLDFAARGGTLVVQYGQYELLAPGIMPYPITIHRPHDRVTQEDAPVRIVDEDSPLMRYPNRIAPSDFAGWVQERALYMPRTFAPEYATVIEMTDPDEPPKRSAILVARLGSGVYVHTSLTFFRQLPNSVPGAARLFVNVLSARPVTSGGAVAAPPTPEMR